MRWSGLVTWHLAMSAASKPHRRIKYCTKKTMIITIDLCLITHHKWQIYLNILFGKYDGFLKVQEDISSLLNNRVKLRNKVLSWKVFSSLFFLPSSVILLQPSTDKDDNKSEKIERTNWVRYKNQKHMIPNQIVNQIFVFPIYKYIYIICKWVVRR